MPTDFNSIDAARVQKESLLDRSFALDDGYDDHISAAVAQPSRVKDQVEAFTELNQIGTRKSALEYDERHFPHISNYCQLFCENPEIGGSVDGIAKILGRKARDIQISRQERTGKLIINIDRQECCLEEYLASHIRRRAFTKNRDHYLASEDFNSDLEDLKHRVIKGEYLYISNSTKHEPYFSAPGFDLRSQITAAAEAERQFRLNKYIVGRYVASEFGRDLGDDLDPEDIGGYWYTADDIGDSTMERVIDMVTAPGGDLPEIFHEGDFVKLERHGDLVALSGTGRDLRTALKGQRAVMLQDQERRIKLVSRQAVAIYSRQDMSIYDQLRNLFTVPKLVARERLQTSREVKILFPIGSGNHWAMGEMSLQLLPSGRLTVHLTHHDPKFRGVDLAEYRDLPTALKQVIHRTFGIALDNINVINSPSQLPMGRQNDDNSCGPITAYEIACTALDLIPIESSKYKCLTPGLRMFDAAKRVITAEKVRGNEEMDREKADAKHALENMLNLGQEVAMFRAIDRSSTSTDFQNEISQRVDYLKKLPYQDFARFSDEIIKAALQDIVCEQRAQAGQAEQLQQTEVLTAEVGRLFQSLDPEVRTSLIDQYRKNADNPNTQWKTSLIRQHFASSGMVQEGGRLSDYAMPAFDNVMAAVIAEQQSGAAAIGGGDTRRGGAAKPRKRKGGSLPRAPSAVQPASESKSAATRVEQGVSLSQSGLDSSPIKKTDIAKWGGSVTDAQTSHETRSVIPASSSGQGRPMTQSPDSDELMKRAAEIAGIDVAKGPDGSLLANQAGGNRDDLDESLRLLNALYKSVTGYQRSPRVFRPPSAHSHGGFLDTIAEAPEFELESEYQVDPTVAAELSATDLVRGERPTTPVRTGPVETSTPNSSPAEHRGVDSGVEGSDRDADVHASREGGGGDPGAPMTEEARQGGAATVIQRWYRGFKVRQDMKQKGIEFSHPNTTAPAVEDGDATEDGHKASVGGDTGRKKRLIKKRDRGRERGDSAPPDSEDESSSVPPRPRGRPRGRPRNLTNTDEAESDTAPVPQVPPQPVRLHNPSLYPTSTMPPASPTLPDNFGRRAPPPTIPYDPSADPTFPAANITGSPAPIVRPSDDYFEDVIRDAASSLFARDRHNPLVTSPPAISAINRRYGGTESDAHTYPKGDIVIGQQRALIKAALQFIDGAKIDESPPSGEKKVAKLTSARNNKASQESIIAIADVVLNRGVKRLDRINRASDVTKQYARDSLALLRSCFGCEDSNNALGQILRDFARNYRAPNQAIKQYDSSYARPSPDTKPFDASAAQSTIRLR